MASRYTFGVIHDFGHIWHQYAFLTAVSAPIKYASFVIDFSCQHVKLQLWLRPGNAVPQMQMKLRVILWLML